MNLTEHGKGGGGSDRESLVCSASVLVRPFVHRSLLASLVLFSVPKLLTILYQPVEFYICQQNLILGKKIETKSTNFSNKISQYFFHLSFVYTGQNILKHQKPTTQIQFTFFPLFSHALTVRLSAC